MPTDKKANPNKETLDLTAIKYSSTSWLVGSLKKKNRIMPPIVAKMITTISIRHK